MITSPVTVSAQKQVNLNTDDMLIWGCVGKQTMISGASDPVYFYFKIDTETYGTGHIKKTSEDGVVSGIKFNISGNGVNKTVTTKADGTVDISLMPGVYTVTEQSIDRYEPQSVQRVTIVSGHTSIGMLVVLDSILNRITQNRAKGRNTFIFIDEIYLLFQHEYSANFLFTLWKRVRKYGAYCTGITQNVDDLLQSHTARTMLANSEFIIMLNQASTDRIELAKLLNISDLQMSYITNVGAGQGLLKVGSSLVPFVNKFPRNTELYRLMTTKFGEV